MAKPEDLAKLYDSIQAKQTEKGVKGEKANSIRDVIRSVVQAKKQKGVTELSQATLRNVVKEIMSTTDAAGNKLEPKLDQSYFSTIINGMYEVKKDPATGAVVVLTGSEKPPKVRTPRAKKEKGAKPAE